MRSVALCLVFLGACSTTSAGPQPTADGGPDVAADDGSTAEGAADAPVNMCSAAIASLLKPINKVTTGIVSILGTSGATKTVYVDASAGGFGNQDSYPRVYVNLESATRVDLTDNQAAASTAWDMAFKRPVIFTNGGDGGPGMGGTRIISKAFDQVTSADATGTFTTESFVDASCNAKMDPTGDILTTLSGWYDYNMVTMALAPTANTAYVIRGATGKLYKLAILNYYATPDGGMGTSNDSANYVFEVAGL